MLPLVQFECSAPHRLTPHTVSNCPRRRQWRADGRVGAAGRASRRRLYCSFMAPHSAPRGVLSMAHTSSQTAAGGCSRSPRAVLGTRGRVDLRVHHAMPAGPAGALRPWPCAHLAALLAAWPCKDAIFCTVLCAKHCVWGHLRLGRSSHSSWRGRLLSSCWLLAPRSKLSRLVLAAKPAVCMYWTGGAALHALRRGSVWPIAPVRRTGAVGRGLAAALASGLASVKASRPGSLLGGSRRVCNGSKKLFVHGSTVNRRLVEAMHKRCA